ncbi:hypothetical protein AVEN_177440-1 [Araneus ventricosus]|uniref:Uncharacterized protein n=1 Tax=Araneus ventricosus TaxID=182803 RepID=A0A4Y2LAT6_ARAVE|nr:hypothetical protein AVEN_177440-1 [Araneus ventricosus]
MLPQDILGAATGVGLALFIALSAIICKYYSRTRKERMILYSPPRRPSQDRRQKRIMHMREASAMAALPPQQQVVDSALAYLLRAAVDELKIRIEKASYVIEMVCHSDVACVTKGSQIGQPIVTQKKNFKLPSVLKPKFYYRS